MLLPEASYSTNRALRFKDWLSRNWLLVYLVSSACLLALLYRHLLGAGFVYDDLPHVVNNPNLHLTPSFFRHYFGEVVPFTSDYLSGPPQTSFRPVFWLSLAIDRDLFGLSPAGFHFTNLLLHWLNGTLGFLLLRKLGLPTPTSGAAALVWITLPINCEAVAWISGRTYLLCTFFVFLSLLAAQSYLCSGSLRLLLAYTLASMGALLSNEAGALVLPLTVLLAALHNKLFSKPACTLYWIAAASSLAFFWLKTSLDHLAPAHVTVFAPFAIVFWKYISWILLPLHMSVERSTDLPGHTATLPSLLASAALLTAAVLTIRFLHRLPAVSFGLLWTGMALLPYTGLLYIYQGMAERYAYLPSFGLALAAVALAQLPKPRVGSVAALFLLVWMAWGAWRLDARVRNWRDEARLFASSLQTNPDSPVLLYNLAASLNDHGGNVDAAIQLTRRALALKPNFERALNGMGTMFLQTGALKDAKKAFEASIALNPRDPEAIANLGIVFLRIAHFYEASVRFERSLALRPGNVPTLINLGYAHMRLADYQQAVDIFRRVLALSPDDTTARCNLAMVFVEQRRWDEAVEQLTTAIQRHPKDPTPYYFFGIADEKMGANQAAIEMYRKAILLRPGFAEADAHLKKLQHAP